MGRLVVQSDIILSVDWLGLSLRLPKPPTDIEGYQWREYSATNVWGKRLILYTDEGDKVCTLLYEPRSSIINSKAALVEIENQWLYHGAGPFYILDVLSKAVFYEILGISRVDLAVDFCPDETQAQVIEGLASGQYYVGGKRNGSGFWSTNNSSWLAQRWQPKRIPHCQSWGHKTSAIKWKLYYKTKELADAGCGRFLDKPYIVDMWRMANFDIKNVWRLEVSIKHGNAYEFDGFRLDLASIRDSRADIFRSLYQNRFQIRKNEGHKDRSNDKIINFLDIDKVPLKVGSAPAKRSTEHNGRITLLRQLVKSLDDEQVLLDKQSREAVLEHMQKIIRRDGLQNYFYAMVGMFFEEYREDIEVRANQRWAVRDALAVPHDGLKGSHAVEDRTLELPKRNNAMGLTPNDKFDEQQTDAQLKWQREFVKSLWPDKKQQNPDWKLNFDSEK